MLVLRDLEKRGSQEAVGVDTIGKPLTQHFAK